ncbi:MAG: hypothetical protein AABY16_02010 [Nanoarchaeota archaeon]
MINLFLISFFITFVVVRVIAHTFHDRKNYGTNAENSKTITGWLRNKTGFDWHHIHLGFILLIISLSLIFYKITSFSIMLLAISLSLITDQILPLLNFGNYFSKKMIIGAIILHLVVSFLAIMIS